MRRNIECKLTAGLLLLVFGFRQFAESFNTLKCVRDNLLKYKYAGDINLKNSTEYNSTISIDNKRVVQYPLAVLSPKHENDVVAAVIASNDCNASFSVRSGGHSAAGYCLSEGIVLNLNKGLHKVKLSPDNATLYIEGGALWSSVYEATKDTGYLPIGGGCTTVSTGFLLGGGWSFLSRSYGLGADNILSLRMVLANGTIIEANENVNHDIFWACRGGGGGNFGVVTSFVLELHRPRSKNFLVGELCWKPFDPIIPKLWEYFLDVYWNESPDWFDIEPAWLLMKNQSIVTVDSRMFCFTVVCNGDPDSECAPLLHPLIAKYPPELNTVLPQPFESWQLSNVNVTDAQEGYLYLTSGIMLPGKMTVNTIEYIIEQLKDSPSMNNLVLFHTGGGAIRKTRSLDTAFPHRDVQLVIQIKAIWDREDDADVNIEWVKNVRKSIAPLLSGSYVNYIDNYLDNWQREYYGENYERLVSIKNRIDPNNFFSFNQSIGTL